MARRAEALFMGGIMERSSIDKQASRMIRFKSLSKRER